MLRRRIITIAAVAVAALSLGGCASLATKDAHFRKIELAPASGPGYELAAELQVVGTKKAMGAARGPVGTPEQENELRVRALEAALASDSSWPDVLVAPSYYDVRVGKDTMTVTVIGYPARYRKFKRNVAVAKSNEPFSVKQLPGGVAVVSYDRGAFTAKLVNDNIIAVQPIYGVNQAAPAAGASAEPSAAPATSTEDKTGE